MVVEAELPAQLLQPVAGVAEEDLGQVGAARLDDGVDELIADAAIAHGELEAGHQGQQLVPGEVGQKVSFGRHAVRADYDRTESTINGERFT
ncbi:hypothetical protein [Sorangium sp. So ce131]|uniref:hypothetical protein n=1 Tax=Sorangium sp. So ce131 TaxID=3133282 RepID=UPI003F63AD7F